MRKVGGQRETPNFQLNGSGCATGNQFGTSEYPDRLENINESNLDCSQNRLDQESLASNSKTMTSGGYRYSRRLDELKRQQAKLDKIKSEKDQLEAYLAYQSEMKKQQQKREQEALEQQAILYNQNAVVIQKYARTWLAKRYVEQLKELEYQNQKALLNQALNEMKDHVRVCGTESKDRFINAAITIQKYARGMFIRKLLKPYFDLMKTVNPMVNALSKVNQSLR